jgi:lysozyme family protein
MTVDQIIEGVLEREKEGTPPYFTPGDRGGRTSWGISERYHPEAWRNGPPTREMAKQIYIMEYAAPFIKFYDQLRTQLVDIAVLHGVSRAWRLLNRTVHGVDTPQPMASIDAIPTRLVNNALVAERLAFIDKLTDFHSSQKKFEEGWESRALSFLL